MISRIKLFITCVLTAFVALINPEDVARIFLDHECMRNKRLNKKKRRHKALVIALDKVKK